MKNAVKIRNFKSTLNQKDVIRKLKTLGKKQLSKIKNCYNYWYKLFEILLISGKYLFHELYFFSGNNKAFLIGIFG